jgi:hypothetical protein
MSDLIGDFIYFHEIVMGNLNIHLDPQTAEEFVFTRRYEDTAE